MLRIRPEQLEVLAKAQLQRFELEAMTHVREYWPDQAEKQGEDGVREAVQLAFERVDSYGIEEEYDVLRYINLMYALGHDFDTRFDWASAVLGDDQRSARERLDELTRRATEFLDGGGEEAAKP